MKIRNKILFRFILVIIIAMLISCSSTDEQESSDDAKPSESVDSSQQTSAKDEKQPAEKSEVEPEPKEESVIEVIPSQGKSTDLTVEPIAQPEEPTESKATESDSPASVVVEEKTAPKIEVPKSTGPNHFVITAETKDKRHPFYGKGHPMGFLVNDVPGKEVVIERGKTYKFDVATDPKHDVYFSTKEIGWGSTPYSKGIEGMYTYRGLITVKPTKETPDFLYYSCRNHPFMGGKVHIVDPGETAKISEVKTSSKKVSKKAEKEEEITEAKAKQKIMYADMLANSKNTQSIADSSISDAVKMHKKATSDLESAKEKLKEGNNQDAYTLAENAVDLFQKATKLVPNKVAVAQLKEQYNELLASIKNFEESHKESYERISKKQGADAAVKYDTAKVSKLKKEAESLSKKGDYPKANDKLTTAQYLITGAIQKMLHSQTIVYDLKFETAEEEYEYEIRRYISYEELVPIAIEQKKPTEQVIKLMETFVKKGQSLRDRAKQKAKEGDFPTAIAMLQDATNDVRRALRMAGVMQ